MHCGHGNSILQGMANTNAFCSGAFSRTHYLGSFAVFGRKLTVNRYYGVAEIVASRGIDPEGWGS